MSAALSAVSTVTIKKITEAGDPSLFRRARTWWLLLALFLLAQANGLFTRQDDTYFSFRRLNQHYESSTVLLISTIILWLISIGLIFGNIRRTLRTMLKQKMVLAFAVLALVSATWSQVPALTVRHSLLMFFLFGFAWYFATYYSPADQLRLLVAAGILLAVASIAMALLLPQYGIASTGEWKGVFAQKNRLGLSILFLFAGLPFRRRSAGRGRAIAALEASLALSLILLSQSRTSLLLAAVIVVVRVFGSSIPRIRREQVPFVIFTTLTITCVFLFGTPVILALLGRNATLTGRTESWALLLPFAFRHPLFGYGFQGFWTGDGDSLRVMRSLGAGMHGSDGGYVDMMLQFGFIGMGLMVVVFVISMREFLRLLRCHPVSLLTLWYAAVILAVYVGSITESLIPSQTGIVTFIFVVACAGLRSLGDSRIERGT